MSTFIFIYFIASVLYNKAAKSLTKRGPLRIYLLKYIYYLYPFCRQQLMWSDVFIYVDMAITVILWHIIHFYIICTIWYPASVISIHRSFIQQYYVDNRNRKNNRFEDVIKKTLKDRKNFQRKWIPSIITIFSPNNVQTKLIQ